MLNFTLLCLLTPEVFQGLARNCLQIRVLRLLTNLSTALMQSLVLEAQAWTCPGASNAGIRQQGEREGLCL